MLAEVLNQAELEPSPSVSSCPESRGLCSSSACARALFATTHLLHLTVLVTAYNINIRLSRLRQKSRVQISPFCRYCTPIPSAYILLQLLLCSSIASSTLFCVDVYHLSTIYRLPFPRCFWFLNSWLLPASFLFFHQFSFFPYFPLFF